MRRMVIALLVVVCLMLALAAPALAGPPPSAPPAQARPGLAAASEGLDTAEETPAPDELPVGTVPGPP